MLGNYYFCNKDSSYIVWYKKYVSEVDRLWQDRNGMLERNSAYYDAAVAAYRIADYKSAAKYFYMAKENMLEISGCGYLYFAMSLMKEKKYQKAVEYFTKYQNQTGKDVSAQINECNKYL